MARATAAGIDLGGEGDVSRGGAALPLSVIPALEAQRPAAGFRGAAPHHRTVAAVGRDGGGRMTDAVRRQALGLAAHLHLACAIPNSSYFEMLHEPPGMSAADFQWYLAEPLQVNADGDIVAPQGPGLGVEPDLDKIARYRI